MQHPFTSVPRTLMLLANLFYSVGAFVADWSHTHVKNPRWPPHARFHNGQTMSLGALLTLVVVYLLSRQQQQRQQPPWSGKKDGGREYAAAAAAAAARDSVLLAAVVGSLYCVAGLSAILYPGTAWIDPEFPQLAVAPQLIIFPGQLALNWAACWAELRRLGGSESGSGSGNGSGDGMVGKGAKAS